ncbi:MAG: site-specific integrase [Bacteroidetes bacterium]|nr:site-specific integrase [Bacteroidota bacterium]MCA6443768.1 site-specific integrase [Bacteroidota bacterium]
MNFKLYLESRNYSVKTIESYEKAITTFLNWLNDEQIKVTEAKYNDVLAYIKHRTDKGDNKSYQQKHITVIRHYYNYLIRVKKVKDNITANINIKGIARRLPHDLLTAEEMEEMYQRYSVVGIIGKRNKLMLGLMVYQGLGTEDLGKLEEAHLNLKDAKINVPARRRSNARTLDLLPEQVEGFTEYITKVRHLLLELTDKETHLLFTSWGASSRFSNMQAVLLRNIKRYMPQIKSLEQIRMSVIAEWVKKYNLREAQYLSGHRYVSSTEVYQQTNVDDLKKSVLAYHPFKQP